MNPGASEREREREGARVEIDAKSRLFIGFSLAEAIPGNLDDYRKRHFLESRTPLNLCLIGF